MAARQRNNISRLPQAVRLHICELLDDGATYDEIREDPEVAAELAKRGVALHSTTFLAYRESAEFDEYRRARRRFSEDIERRKMAAFFVDHEGGSDAVANAATFELLRIVFNKLENAEELEPKELASVSGALAAYQRNRISESKDDAKREFAQRESEYQAKIAELSARVAELAAGGKSAGLTPETLKAIEEKIGLL